MATLSLVELLKSEADPVMSGLIENIATVDQLTAFMPFNTIGSTDHVNWLREKALPTTSTPTSGASITPDTALEFDRVTSYVRRFIIDQDIDVLDSGAVGGMGMARAKAIAAAGKSLGRKYSADVLTGNANWTVTVNEYGSSGITGATIVVGPGQDPREGPGVIRYTHVGTTLAYKAPGDTEYGAEVTIGAGVKVYSDNPNKWIQFTVTAGAAAANGYIVFSFAATASSTPIDGLSRILAASQTVTPSGADGDDVSLALLDQLADLVTDKSGQKFYLMHSRTRRKVMALMRAAGGVTMSELRAPVFGSGQGELLPEYNGIPILRSDFLSIAETVGGTTTASRIYCMTLGPDAGVSGIFSTASVEAADAGEILSTGPTGLTVLNVGTVQNSDAKRVRVKAYWGLASKSELGLACATGIK